MGLHFIKAPGRIPSNIRAYFWFLTESHPKVDVVIESLDFFNFNFKKTATVLYLPDHMGETSINRITKAVKNKMIKLVASKYLKNFNFTTSDFRLFELLKRSNVDPEKLFLLKKGLNTEELNQKTVVHYDRSLLIDLVKRSEIVYEMVFKVIEAIDRKSEEWIFTILTQSSLLKKIRKELEKLGLQSKVNVWVGGSRKTFARELARSDILFDPSLNQYTFNDDLFAMSRGIIVVTFKNKIVKEYDGFGRSVWMIGKKDPQSIAGRIMKLANDIELRKLLIKRSLQFSSKNSWEELSLESIRFLGNIKPR